METTFEGKVCVVTGAASGIGRALALRLAASGAMLALSDVNEAALRETQRLAGEASNRIRIDPLNVADANAIERYPAVVEQSFGPADYVFNVAGVTRVGDFEDTPLSSFETIMDVNFWGVVRMSKAFLPHLLQTKGGIVNISSVFGLVGFSGQAHYCASKFAVRGFSETIGLELQDKGVRVTSVHPGGVDTNIARSAEFDVDRGPDASAALAQEFKKSAITSPDDAARIILDGVAKGKRRVMVGRDAKFISLVQRLFPARYTRFFRALSGGRPLSTAEAATSGGAAE
ncbi:MAG: SDR family NAD(P)-dependent oxidoreductase [Pseudomonadota bacterium]